jgi:serine/threonine protein phosphatase 1
MAVVKIGAVARRFGTSKTKPRIPANMRVYAIGDVHGRADLLRDLFVQIDADLLARPISYSVEILLGDYIDRGPESREVIQLLITRGRHHSMHCLAGNHEIFVSQFLNDPSVLSAWKHLGGLSTLASYGLAPSMNADPHEQRELAEAFRLTIPKTHLRFLDNLPVTYACGDFFFTHAGVRPGIALQQQSKRDLLLIREDFLLHEGDFGKIIVHGHTPVMEPDVRPNRINIDTGAFATGRLTCLVLESDQMTFV